ncbi:MAG: hypothetical protein ABI851_16435 [Saprospiraceae bacterium]
MVIKELSYSIVLVGKWNPAILTPLWLGSNLFDDKPSIEIEFSLNFDVPTRYRVKNIIIAPGIDRVQLLSIDNSDESLSLMESIAIKLCRTLSHTPLVAVGINFAYIEQKHNDALLPLMNFADADKIIDDGWQTSNQSIKRTLQKNGYNINLAISVDEKYNFDFDFNFHYPTTTATLVSECLSGKVIDFKNQATALLHQLFNLEIQTNV